jgi:hypothetical protein
MHSFLFYLQDFFAGLNSGPEISNLLVNGYILLLIMPSLFTIHVQFMLDLLALVETCARGEGEQRP